jgi:hypothetical protein
MDLVVPRSYWDAEDTLSSVISRVSSLALDSDNVPGVKGSVGTSNKDDLSVFNVIALVQKDSSLSLDALGEGIRSQSPIVSTLDAAGEKIKK